MKQLTVIALGWMFTVVGILGVVVPILPGIPLLLVGLVLLGRHYAWARRLIDLFRAKAQRLARLFRLSRSEIKRQHESEHPSS